MSNDKSILTILTDTLAIVAERALTTENTLAAKTEDSDNWYTYYKEQKERVVELELELQAVRGQLVEAEARAGQMEAELAALNEKGAEDRE